VIYVLTTKAGISGYGRIVKVVEARDAKEARSVATNDHYGTTCKCWEIITKVKQPLKG
jgi:hypothetical protein